MLWIHPDRARPLGIADGDEVEINGGGSYVGPHQGQGDAVDPSRGGVHAARLRRHGAARHARPAACGVADQRLQHGKLYDFDPAGGGCAMTETIVQVKPAVAGGGNQ